MGILGGWGTVVPNRVDSWHWRLDRNFLMIIKQAEETGHWYTRDGSPMYTIEGKNGRRNTTLRDARKHDLVPSVTTLLNILARPGLTTWLQQQVLLAALTLPREPEEPESDYIARILSDAKAQGKAAADAGTSIHVAIQDYYEGKPSYEHEQHTKGCTDALDAYFGKQAWICERSFAHEVGYGGRCDLYALGTDDHQGLVVDIKTKEFADIKDATGYDEHLMQLAAYRVGLGVPAARCANVYVSRTVPGLSVVQEWGAEELDNAWIRFLLLVNYWKLKNGI
jgi:hypothetical protein